MFRRVCGRLAARCRMVAPPPRGHWTEGLDQITHQYLSPLSGSQTPEERLIMTITESITWVRGRHCAVDGVTKDWFATLRILE